MIREVITVDKKQYEMLVSEHKSYREQIDLLKYELAELKRMIFGSKHERFAPDASPDQLALGFELEAQPIAPPPIQSIQYTRQKPQDKKPPHRLPLPAHLPRERVVIEPEGDVSQLKAIGEEITEELDLVPGNSLSVNKYGLNTPNRKVMFTEFTINSISKTELNRLTAWIMYGATLKRRWRMTGSELRMRYR